MFRPIGPLMPIQDHPPELIEHYVFTCDAADIAARIRSLKNARVRADAVIRVACRLVYFGAKTLFRPGYDGSAYPEDEWTLADHLIADEIGNPDDYSADPGMLERPRAVPSQQDDVVLELDFVDPQISLRRGNMLIAARRTIRLRDRVSLTDLDAISAFFLAQKAVDPTVKMEFVDQTRWRLIA